MQVSHVGFSTNSSSQLSFVDQFFERAVLSEGDRSNQRIRELLVRLQDASCTMDDKMVVHGTEQGKNWPLIKLPVSHQVVNGLAIGVRGSSGIGSTTLEQYLEKLVGDLKVQSATTPVLQQPPPQQPFSTSAPGGGQRALLDVILACGGNNLALNTSTSMSLEQIRKFQAFIGPPPQAVNQFTIDDFFGATLYVLDGGRCLVVKDKRVLAHHQSITISPTGVAGLYDHGGGQLSDVPCKEIPKLTTKLKNREDLMELLPYLQGIPKL